MYYQVLDVNTDVQSQKAVSAHFVSKQILPYDFATEYRVIIIR